MNVRAPAGGRLGDLAEVPLFEGLSREQLEKLDGLLHRKKYPAGAEIITVEQPGEVAYVILSGSVKIHIGQPDGSDVILAILGPGELVGEMSLADSLGRSATVVTLEESVLLWMGRPHFHASLREMPAMTLNLVNILSRRLRLANVHAQSLSRLDVHGRVAEQLLAFAREYGEELPDGVRIPLRLTQSDLAGLVGASRVRVNQALGFFRRRNQVSVDRDNRLVVRDREALARRCR